MARDWRFPPGSFNGVTFYVDTGAPVGGRRKVIHEYPGSEFWDVEDLGTKAKKVTVTAYFCSETADIDYAALVAVCDQPGPGELSLPFFGVVTASAETWEPRWSQEKLNYCGGDFSFILENPANAPVAIGLFPRLMAALLVTASSTIGAAVSSVFVGLPTTSYERSDAAAALLDTQAFVETVRQSTSLPDKTNVAARNTLANLQAAAVSASETDPGTFVASALAVLDNIVVDADPDIAGADFRTAAALAVSMVPATLTGQLDASQASGTVSAALAVAASMQAIRMTATSTYTDRITAIAARQTIQDLATAVLPVVGALGADATAAFSDLWGQAVTYLTRVITNLAPVVLYQANVSLPSTVLAYRLYGDPSRGSELVARNRVSTPIFMPTLFEASSS